MVKCQLPSLITLVGGWFALKMLCFHAYFSTDFEVHRNWLAITHSLPLSKWYTENTSQWTLDYPPLFAWFEYFLSEVAALVEPEMLKISASPRISSTAVIFQRSSVIATDVLYIVSSLFMSRRCKSPRAVFSLLCFNAGLFLVDSVHFQYNSFLFAVLLFSIGLISEGKIVSGFAVFVILFNLKHLFLCLVPSYAAYIFGVYLWPERFNCYGRLIFRWRTFLVGLAKLGSVAVSISAMSLGPFIYFGQGKLLLARLFPFKRGLTHAYWAPNFWALYNFVDYSLYAIGTHRGFISRHRRPGYTSGMVKDVIHVVLPSVAPFATFACTAAGVLPFCAVVAWNPSRSSFVKLLTACSFVSFLFGWHVHEKAVLTIVIPLSLLAIEDKRYARLFLVLSFVGHYSLFPLLFKPMEIFVKYPVLILSYALSYYALKLNYYKSLGRAVHFLNRCDVMYLAGVVPVEIFHIITTCFPRFSAFPFLPLMATSVYCAIGVCYCFALYCQIFFIDTFPAQKASK